MTHPARSTAAMLVGLLLPFLLAGCSGSDGDDVADGTGGGSRPATGDFRTQLVGDGVPEVFGTDLLVKAGEVRLTSAVGSGQPQFGVLHGDEDGGDPHATMALLQGVTALDGNSVFVLNDGWGYFFRFLPQWRPRARGRRTAPIGVMGMFILAIDDNGTPGNTDDDADFTMLVAGADGTRPPKVDVLLAPRRTGDDLPKSTGLPTTAPAFTLDALGAYVLVPHVWDGDPSTTPKVGQLDDPGTDARIRTLYDTIRGRLRAAGVVLARYDPPAGPAPADSTASQTPAEESSP